MVAAPYPRYGIPFRPLIYVLALAMASAVFSRRALAPAARLPVSAPSIHGVSG